MGCGASVPGGAARSADAKDAKAGEAGGSATPEVADTWATRTDVVVETGRPPLHDTRQGSSTLPGRHGEALLLDAYDDDDVDEIEIIQEASPLHRRDLGLGGRGYPSGSRADMANGQEAPQADYKAVPAEPLSKQQMEEAAKLAERRKRFDNQRYQKEQRDAQGSPDVNPFGVPTLVSQSTPSAANTHAISAAPPTDAMLGFSLTEVDARDVGLQGGFLYESLPGGIDEGESMKAIQVGKKRRKNHDDVESTGFDADDERLMMEILENCDI